MKGYELYSWKVGTDWNYTLITGTNRPKTFEEVSAATGVVDDHGWTKITLRGVQKTAQVMARLPKGESVVWTCPAGQGYSWPEEDVIAQISDAAQSRGLDFRVER